MLMVQGTAASLLQNLAFLQPECALLEDLDELTEEEQVHLLPPTTQHSCHCWIKRTARFP